MAKGSHRDPAETKAESVGDALRGVTVDHSGTAPTGEFDQLAQQLQDKDLQDQATTDHPVDANDPTGSGQQSSGQDLAKQWLEGHSGSSAGAGGTSSSGQSGSGTSADAGLTGSPFSETVHSEQDLWEHLTQGNTGEDDSAPDPSGNPRDVLTGIENQFGSSFDRLADLAKEPTGDPNPNAGVGKGEAGLEDGLQTGADFLHNQGLNPTPTVSGGDNTPIGQEARQAKLEDDLDSGRATQHTSKDGSITVTKWTDGTTQVDDRNNNTRTTEKSDGSTVTQNLTTGKVTDTTKPSTSMPDEDHQTVLPKNFNKGLFDADGHIELGRQFEHRHDPTNTDPNDGDPSLTAVPTSGPIPDAKTHLLGDPGNDPNASPDFGGGAGHGTLPNEGTIPTDPNQGHATDPGEQAETGPPQSTGPSERTVHNPTPSMQSGGSPGSGSGNQSSETGDGHSGTGTPVPGTPVLTDPHIPHLELQDQSSAPSSTAVHKSADHVSSDPAASGGTHDPAASGGMHDPAAEHPILPEPVVPEVHDIEVPPPVHAEETNLDPGSHHVIPEQEQHHIDPHLPPG